MKHKFAQDPHVFFFEQARTGHGIARTDQNIDRHDDIQNLQHALLAFMLGEPVKRLF